VRGVHAFSLGSSSRGSGRKGKGGTEEAESARGRGIEEGTKVQRCRNRENVKVGRTVSLVAC